MFQYADIEMVNIGEAGRICLNPEIPGVCQSCLWWEWDNHRGECANSHYHICPLYQEQLFSQGAQEQNLSGLPQAMALRSIKPHV